MHLDRITLCQNQLHLILQIGISISEPLQFTETSSIQRRPTRLSTTNIDEISIRLCDINICMVTDQRLCFRYTDGTIPLLSKSVHVQLGLCRTCSKNHSVELLMTRVICEDGTMRPFITKTCPCNEQRFLKL